MLQNVRISHSTEEKKKEFVFGATIGVSALNDIETPRDVLAHASIAYQAARIRGVGTLVYYSEGIHKRLMENQTIISQFVPSLEAGEFVGNDLEELHKVVVAFVGLLNAEKDHEKRQHERDRRAEEREAYRVRNADGEERALVVRHVGHGGERVGRVAVGMDGGVDDVGEL